MADAEPLARAICAACAQLHRPHAPLQDINQANVRLIQLCEHAQAPQACVLIVRHGAQLVTQGAPVHACALAANVVERACRERNVSGDDAFALLEALDNNEAGDACAGAVCAGVAFWSVEAGQEAAALDRCAQRPVALAIAVAEELARRGACRDAGGAWRALARGTPSITRLAQCVAHTPVPRLVSPFRSYVRHARASKPSRASRLDARGAVRVVGPQPVESSARTRPGKGTDSCGLF